MEVNVGHAFKRMQKTHETSIFNLKSLFLSIASTLKSKTRN